MKTRTKIGLGALGVTAIAVALGWGPARRHYDAAMLLSQFEGESAPRVPERDLRLGTARARRYGTCDGPVVMLLHGVHSDGIDEPRFTRFARLLAVSGLCITTPEIAALRELRFDPRAVDAIDDAARALARREHRSKIGVIAISFGGGLALMAAARDDTAIGAVLAIGPHHDAVRLARWWLGDPIEGPDRERVTIEPERYGAGVLAYAFGDEYFDGLADAERAREALRARLEERRLRIDLSEEARARIDLGDRDRLRAIVDAHADDLAAVSPRGRLGSLRIPVFLLHGAGDTLIAPTESAWIAHEMPAELVRTPLIGHADRDPDAGLGAKLEVVHLMASALGAFEDLR